jgi:hypothetical protein
MVAIGGRADLKARPVQQVRLIGARSMPGYFFQAVAKSVRACISDRRRSNVSDRA